MASVTKDNSGLRIRFFDATGNRRTLRPGFSSRRKANALAVRIESLVACRTSGTPLDSTTKTWLQELPAKIHEKLQTWQLVEPRRTEATRFPAFIDAFIAEGKTARGDTASKQTVANWKTARRAAVDFFGDVPLQSITPVESQAFSRYMRMPKPDGLGFAENTVRKNITVLKLVFRQAIRMEILEKNPFDLIPSTSVANDERFYFITEGDYQKLLSACPDHSWRLLIALGRYGGLRLPSEAKHLTWEDFKEDRIVVRTIKTEHHANRKLKHVPLFLEIEAETKHKTTGLVFPDLPNALSSYLGKIFRKAGVYDKKPATNLRATRRNELEGQFPDHVINCWFGHSQGVSEQHYLKVSDEHFQAAVGNNSSGPHLAHLSQPQGTLEDIVKSLSREETLDLLRIATEHLASF